MPLNDLAYVSHNMQCQWTWLITTATTIIVVNLLSSISIRQGNCRTISHTMHCNAWHFTITSFPRISWMWLKTFTIQVVLMMSRGRKLHDAPYARRWWMTTLKSRLIRKSKFRVWENWNNFSFRLKRNFLVHFLLCHIVIHIATYRGSRFEIIRSASSGVGGANFSSVFASPPSLLTVGSVERAGATSSVGRKSGTNFALQEEG